MHRPLGNHGTEPADHGVTMARVEIGQTVINGDLRWWRAGSADDGRVFEEDGKGMPPPKTSDAV